MALLDIIKARRSIRKYKSEQIPKEAIGKILEAGVCAPNAGGRQGTMLVGVHNAELCKEIGIMNMQSFDRSKLIGSFVSKEQPSVIDDKNIQNGFYDAPSVICVFEPKNFLFSIPDAFCAAENIVLQATELGISSCIISRAEQTFDNEQGKALLCKWNIPENYIARCFVILGYIDGEAPQSKPINKDRIKIVE